MISSDTEYSLHQSALFPGMSCFPLSPCEEEDNEDIIEGYPINSHDQIQSIFDIIGTPLNKQAYSFVSDESALEYLRLIPPRAPIPYGDLFPEANDDCLDLLDLMLEFNPEQRCSVDMLLEHRFFKEIRNKRKEREAKSPIVLEIDEYDEVDEDLLRQGLLKEAYAYKN